ncbi:MAG TPA: aminotransferase class IV [Gaiellaceae bacterium]|nr:aminotransferase class IV [Gaiellaceae bacterium]
MEAPGRVVWHNGRLVPEADARISIYDSALMFGDMAFEMTRSFNGVQFKLRKHLERLYASMKYLRIRVPMTIDEMEQACYDTIEANRPTFQPDDEHRLMIDVSRGLLSIYEGVVGLEPGPNVMIADFPLRWTVAGMSRLFDVGVNAVIPSQRAVPAELLDPKVKNRSRIHYMMANIEVAGHAGEGNWALMLDPDGFVAEGSGVNFFIVRDGRILTPEGRNVLRGISRDYVIHELAPQLGLECVEANIDRYDVVNADEAFMTGTPFCVLPVTALDHDAIGEGKPGAVTKSLLDAWSANVGLDIVGQIRGWDEARPDRDWHAVSPYRFAPAADEPEG